VQELIGWPRPRQVLISALIACLCLLYAWHFLLPIVGPQTPRADDFQDYLYAAHQIASGGDPYGNFARTHVPWDWSLSSGYVYPAAFAAMLVPLTWLPNDLAVRLWLLLIQGSIVASVVIMYAVLGRPRRPELLALVTVLTTFFPLLNTMWTGAMNALLLLLLTAAWACWRKRADVASGSLIAIAAVFKIFPVVVLGYLAWRRDWRLVGAAVVTGIAGLGLCLLVTGLAHNLYYFGEMLPHLAVGTGFRENQSLAGLSARLCNPATADHGGGAGWGGRLVDWPAVLVIVGLTGYAARRGSRSALEFGLAITAMSLISSVTWSFHLVVLIFPIVLLVREVIQHQATPARTRLLFLAWLCFSAGAGAHYALIASPLPHWPGLLDLAPKAATWLLGESYLVGTLILFASVLLALRQERRRAVAMAGALAA